MSIELQNYSVPRLAWSIPEVELALGISRSTVYNMVHDGRLRTIKLRGRTLIPDTEMQRLMSEAGRKPCTKIDAQEPAA